MSKSENFDWDTLGTKEGDSGNVLFDLNDYKDVTPERTEPIPPPVSDSEETPAPESTNPPGPNPGTENVYDSRYYYQSGAKKGQRRKTPKVSYNMPPDKVSSLGGAFLTGALFLTMIDLLFPMLIAVVNNQFTKTKIDPDNLRLDAAQKKELQPVADEVVKYINFEANPVILLLIGLGGVYGMNFYIQKQKANESLKTSKQK